MNTHQASVLPSTPSRKRDHVELCVHDDVQFTAKTAGFERVELLHNALPELDYSDIDTATTFFGKPLAMPLMISSMTGGYAEAENINRSLAIACAEYGIALGVGSQRQALEDSTHHASFRVAREYHPHGFITANIGAPEIAQRSVRESLHRIIELIEANALTIHLNPLQELLQVGGNTSFSGVLTGIEECAQYLRIPIIVKEVGAGISRAVAEKLLDVGVQAIDVAGAGGTSWAGVELRRSALLHTEQAHLNALWNWGIPTTECLQALAPLKHPLPDDTDNNALRNAPRNASFTLIASGGINSGFDMAKSLALGADISASARPFMKQLIDHGQDGLHTMLSQWREQLMACMFLTGSGNISAMQNVSYILR